MYNHSDCCSRGKCNDVQGLFLIYMYKSIQKTALRWRQRMEEAPRHLCPNDLSDEAFINVLERALWKKGKSLDIQGDLYIVIE